MGNTDARALWLNILTDIEKESSVIVKKLLQYNNNHSLFHYRPWDTRPIYYNEGEIIDLPAKFINDPNAFIAITKQDSFIQNNGRSSYDVPAQFQDNFDAMKAICSVSVYTLCKASDRLRDNEDLVFAVCFSKKAKGMEMEAIQYASDRLQSSKDFILKCFLEISTICHQNKDYRKSEYIKLFDWMGYGHGIFCKEDDNQKSGNFSVQDMSEFLRVLPPNEAADAAEYYPDIFFENEDAILELMKRLDHPAAEKLYRLKAEKLQQSLMKVREIVGPDIILQVVNENKEDEEEMRTRENIISRISSSKITRFAEIPEKYLIDQSVLTKSIECGWFDAGLESFLSFTAAIKAAPGVWEERFESWDYEECKLYSMLPEHLKKDKEVAIALLELGCDETDLMLENIPSLVNSKRAMMAMVQVTGEDVRRNGGTCEPDHYLRQCPHRGDKELMVVALDMNSDNIELVNDELFEDRDFMERVGYPWAIAKSSDEFQMKNLDLVEKAMAHLNQFGVHHDDWKKCISSKVWEDRSMVIKYLRNAKGWYGNRFILELLHDIDKAHPLLNDEEVVSLSTKARPSDLQYVHGDLRNDKSFILQFVREAERILQYVPGKFIREAERILHYVPRKMRYDFDIITAAISKSDGNIVDCFNILKSDGDAEYLTTFMHQTKKSLQLHDMYMQVFLMGASRDDQHTVHPSVRSPLPMLNQGAETSTKLKKMIASYAGVPIGQSFIEVKGAVAALERFGF